MSFLKKLKTLPPLLVPFLFIILAGIPISSSNAQEIPEDPSFKDRKVDEGFTLNLKDLIDKSKKKIEQVDGKLKEQARDRRNQQREEKAREYYDKAMTYYEQGDLEAARELWEKAIKITEHEEMEGYLDKSVQRQRKKEKVLEKEEEKRVKQLEIERGYTAKEVNKKYKEAVNLYKDKNFLAAKVAFEEVDQMFPDHRATKSYLALIDRKIEDEQKNMIEDKLNNKELTSAKAKARWKKELEEQEEARQRNLDKQADAMYKEAVRLYKDKQFDKAKEKFKEIEWILPDYKDTIKYLSKIDKDIAKNGVQFTEEDKLKYFKKQIKQTRKNEEMESKSQVKLEEVKEFSETRRRQEEAAFVYDAAQTLYKKKYYAQALEKFYEVNALSPNYESTQKYIKKLEQKIPDKEKKQMAEVKSKTEEKSQGESQSIVATNEAIAKAISERQQAQLKQAEEKYQQALKFYNSQNYIEAQKGFVAVESVVPGYKATRDYLGHIDGDLSKKLQTAKNDLPLNDQKEIKKNDKGKNSELPKNADFKDKYKQAKKLYHQKEFNAAKQLFVAVNDEKPGYRSTLKYLSKINKRINHGNGEHHETKKLAKNNVQSPTSINHFSMGDKENEKVSESKGPEEPSREEKKYQEAIDAAKKDGGAKSEKSLDDVIEKTYSEALELYELERLSAAKAKFTTVEELSPGYKEAARYIKEAEQKLVLQESGDVENKTQPLNHVPDVQKETPSKDSSGKPSRRSLKDPDLVDSEMREVIRSGNESEVKELYNLARRLYKAKNYQKSKNIFTLIQEKYPAYKSSLKYLAKIDQRIEHERLQREKFQQLALQTKDQQPLNAQEVKTTTQPNQMDPLTAKPATVDEQKIKQQTQQYFDALDKLPRKEKKEYEHKQKLFRKQQQTLQESVNEDSAEKDQLVKSVQEEGKTGKPLNEDPVVLEKHSDRYLKRMQELKKEETQLKAEYDASAVAKSMKDEIATQPSNPVSQRKSNRKNSQPLDPEEAEMQEAKKSRLQRLEEEELQETEDRVAFQREVNLKLKEMENQENEEIKKFKQHDMTVKKEEQNRIREEQAKRKEIKKQTLKDLAAVKQETIKFLKSNEPGRAKEMMFQYEDLITKGDFTEKERLALRNDLSKEKLKIQKIQEKARFKDERIAYEKIDRTPEDENKLKIQRQRELDKIEARIREEERKLKAAQSKEDARLKRITLQKEKELKKKDNGQVKQIDPAMTAGQTGSAENKDSKLMTDLDRKKKVEIEKLVMDRKKELKRKREEIQKEFDKSLVLLYKKAEKYYQQGLHDESRQIFEEIQRLRPGYKNTQGYLSKMYQSDFSRQQLKVSQKKTYVRRKTAPANESFARPANNDKQSRLEIIKNTLDNFEETMW